MRRFIIVLVVVSFVFCAMMASALKGQPIKTSASTITVPDDYPTIQDAINRANNGDTIFVKAGTYYENIIVNKTLSLVGEDSETTIIDGQRMGTIVQIAADNVDFCGFTVQNGGGDISEPAIGIFILSYYTPDSPCYSNISNNIIRSGYCAILFGYGSNNSIIANNTISDFKDAICGINSYTGNIITGNNITNCQYGMEIESLSDDWLVSDNTITCSYCGITTNTIDNITIANNNFQCTSLNPQSYAIEIQYSDSTTIGDTVFNNTIGDEFSSSAFAYGLYFTDSKYNVIANNTVLKAASCALCLLDYSDRNIVQNNTLSSSNVGVSLSNSWYSVVFHNRFLADGVQVESVDSQNTWDNGYPSGGNYWKDYAGADFFSGPYQNETGSDGIGDTPYIIDANNRDNYPLYYADTVPPNITSITITPLMPNYDQSVEVSCMVTDNVGVSQAILSYQTSSGWINASMNGFGALFNATMPQRPYGTTVQYEVYANDTSGNWAESATYSYTVQDFVPPSIVTVNWQPTNPSPYVPSNVTRTNEPTLITANVTEPINASGIQGVTLCYEADAGGWWNTTMTYNATTRLWTQTIPGQPNSTNTVQFLIQAYDNAGTLNTSSVYGYQIHSLPVGDINGDGVVNILDAILLANHFGEHYP